MVKIMTQQEFMLSRQKAIERMFETANNKIGVKDEIKTPNFVKTKIDNKQSNNKNENNNDNFIKNLFQNDLKIPFLDKIKTDGDIGIILGLILLLMNDNCDKYLLIALLYIMI